MRIYCAVSCFVYDGMVIHWCNIVRVTILLNFIFI